MIESVTWENIDKLIPSPKNPNKHPAEQIERLAEIIRYQGFRSPIVVSNRTGHIVVGHGRLEAAKKLGLTKVPVSYQDFTDWDQEYAHMVADNAIADWADLDVGQIKEEISNLGDLDIDLLGMKELEFDEPAEKKESEDKEAELKTCPNCGVLIDGM